MPSPNLIAASLACQCPDTNIVVLHLGGAVSLPRVAEELAMLDCITGGRMVAGFPVGSPMDTIFAYGQNPATLRERYQEGVELILRAWQADEVFSFTGRYNKLRYVNVWPLPAGSPPAGVDPRRGRSTRGTGAPRTTSSTATCRTSGTRPA